MKTNKLVYWNNVLDRQGYQCELIQTDSQIPYPRLQISLGNDEQDRPRTLELRLDSYLLPTDLNRKNEALKSESQEQTVVHLFVGLPFLIPPDRFGEVSRFLLLLNKPLDMGGFGLDERTGVPFFRHSLFTYNGNLSTRLLVATVGTIYLLADTLSPQIEAIANGMSMKQLLSALVCSLTGTDLKAG